MNRNALPALGALVLAVVIALVSLPRSGPGGLRHRPSEAPPGATEETWVRRSLRPVTTPAPVHDTIPRLRPARLALDRNQRKIYVTLGGTELVPRQRVQVWDLRKRSLLTSIRVGVAPHGIALHPSGRWVVVTNRFSNFLSVVDTGRDEVVTEIPVPFYCEDLVFTPDGKRAFVSNSWKDQVLVIDLEIEGDRLQGQMRDLGMGGESFLGKRTWEDVSRSTCRACGWIGEAFTTCPHCASPEVTQELVREEQPDLGSVREVLRGRCGTTLCHEYRRGGFYAGPDEKMAFLSAFAHSSPGDPEGSVILRATLPSDKGGFTGVLDSRHHPGGVVFQDPEHDADYQVISKWIREGRTGPGISSGVMPRDLALSPDGTELYVGNTASLDVSVIDLASLRETRRIWVQSAVNDVAFAGDRLLIATIGLGSGHPKERDPAREAFSFAKETVIDVTKRWKGGDSPADFAIYRNEGQLKLGFPTADPTVLYITDPLGPFDHVDGTAKEATRDITNDIVYLDPKTANVAFYQAREEFTRYTSDTYEAMAGDDRGDVEPRLMKVVGAFPEQMLVHGDRLYVAMAASYEVQEWKIVPTAEPHLRLQPSRVWEVGDSPNDLAVVDDTLITVDRLGESLSFVEMASGKVETVLLDPRNPDFPATDYERGEMLVETAIFAIDGDQACTHCHYRDTNDGKKWSNMGTLGRGWRGDERFGGSREIPDLRGLKEKEPFLLEGVETCYELVPQLLQVMPLVDFQGKTPIGYFTLVFFEPGVSKPFPPAAINTIKPGEKLLYAPNEKLEDLLERRRQFLARVSQRYMGRIIDFPEMVRLVGVYLEGQPRYLPNPVDKTEVMVQEGKLLFESPETACSSCHPAPKFTDKETPQNQNRSFFPLISPAPRDNAVTLISSNYQDRVRYGVKLPPDGSQGRIEENEGHYVAPSLRGMWAEPPIMLHHGHAVTMREVVCTPGHIALRRFPYLRPDLVRPGGWEKGQNEMEGILDTHGTTSHLNTWEIECLLAFLESIE